MSKLRQRPNLVASLGEHFKPPNYPPGGGALAHLRSRLLRFIDLQTSTIWRDLSEALPQAHGTVVDVGCGVQPYRHLFGDGVKYIAIDRAEAGQQFGFDAPDTLYYSGDRWPLESGSADFILCTETLEHVLVPGVFLGEMFRCLKPGGRVLLTTPFAARWHHVPYDYWRPTPSALNHLMTQAGFVDVGVYGRGNQLTVACYKGMGFVFSLLSPQPSNAAFEWLCRGVGALGVPLMLALAALANATKGWHGAVDFLGFTIVAEKHSASG